MPNYRRAKVKGGTYFFTVVTCGRRPILCNDDIRGALSEAIRTVQAAERFSIDAWVLLPDHLHCIWTLPADDSDYSKRWAMIKRFVSAQCGPRYRAGIAITDSKRRRSEGVLWQRRFWEHLVRDRDDFERCSDYLHWNPVKHGLVTRVADWPFSTFHRYVQRGMYPPDWGDTPVDGEGFGE